MSLFASVLHLHCPWVRLHLLCLLLVLLHCLCFTVTKRELRSTQSNTLTHANTTLANCSTCGNGGANENGTAKDSSDKTQVLLQHNLSSASDEKRLNLHNNHTFNNSSTNPLISVSSDSGSHILKALSHNSQAVTPDIHPPLPSVNTVPSSVSPARGTKSASSASSETNNVSTNSEPGSNISLDMPTVPVVSPNTMMTANTSPPTTTVELIKSNADTTPTNANTTITRVIPTPTNKPSPSSKAATPQPNEPNIEIPQKSTTTSPPSETQGDTAAPTTTTNPTTHHSEVVATATRAVLVEVAGAALSMQLVDTASLMAVLLFGLLFFLVTVLVFVNQAYESYRRKDYTQVDYLINGMYTDSGV